MAGNSTAPQVRPVQPEEHPHFLEWLADYFRELDGYYAPGAQPSEPADRRAESYLRHVLTGVGPPRYLWWSLLGDAPIGFVIFRVLPNWRQPEELEGLVDEFYILPEHRRRGRGRALAQQVFPLMRERGAVRIRLSVLLRNEAAQAFWGSLGFEPTSRLFETALFMERPAADSGTPSHPAPA